ncbi:hypothetical protein [Candidatus Chlorohelix allophototropha]
MILRSREKLGEGLCRVLHPLPTCATYTLKPDNDVTVSGQKL